MHIELLYMIEYVCKFQKGFGMEQVLNKLAVKKLFYGSIGFGELIWTLILPEKQKSWILYTGGGGNSLYMT